MPKMCMMSAQFCETEMTKIPTYISVHRQMSVFGYIKEHERGC